MFRTARMRKLNVITLDKYASPTVSALHDEGIVQINDISERIQQDPKLAELLKPSKVTPHTGKLSSLLMKTSGISDLLGDALSGGSKHEGFDNVLYQSGPSSSKRSRGC